MKYFYMVFATLMILMMSHNGLAQPHKATTKKISYEYKSGDISVKGTGITKNSARSNASEHCFEHRMNMFQKQRGHVPSEDQALMIIDSCVNI